MSYFIDRIDAGQQLATALASYKDNPNTIILALPRGGVPIGFEISKELQIPLDIFLVRKLGVPGQKELAMGAIAMGDVEALNEDIIQQLQISTKTIASVKAQEEQVLQTRNFLYRENRPMPMIKGQTVILVDDGIATGATIRVAITAIRQLGCEHIIVAVPVAPQSTLDALKPTVDSTYCLFTPEPFFAIGSWYADFSQTSDEEVRTLLARRHKAAPAKGDNKNQQDFKE